jgi:hypothetical protein
MWRNLVAGARTRTRFEAVQARCAATWDRLVCRAVRRDATEMRLWRDGRSGSGDTQTVVRAGRAVCRSPPRGASRRAAARPLAPRVWRST